MEMRTKLFTLWVFAILNYLYADVLGLMDSSLLRQYLAGAIGTMVVSQEFLFGAAVLMESALVMVVLSRFLNRPWNRWTNVVIGLLHTAAVAGSLFVGSPTLYYGLFAVIEIVTTLTIVGLALTWKKEPDGSPAAPL